MHVDEEVLIREFFIKRGSLNLTIIRGLFNSFLKDLSDYC